MSYYKEDSVCWWLMSALLTDFPRARKNGSIFMFVEVKLIQTHRYHYIALPLSIPILFINRKSFFFFSFSTSLFSSEKYSLFGLFGKWTRDRNKSVEKMKKKTMPKCIFIRICNRSSSWSAEMRHPKSRTMSFIWSGRNWVKASWFKTKWRRTNRVNMKWAHCGFD